jgi:NAD(P)-dependent dehydrogenase (short-subunit alcohol dehydrogenase family)
VTFHQPLDDWEEAIDVNLKATMRLSKLAYPHLLTERALKKFVLIFRSFRAAAVSSEILTHRYLVYLQSRCAIINIGSLSGVQAFGDLTPCTSDWQNLILLQ